MIGWEAMKTYRAFVENQDGDRTYYRWPEGDAWRSVGHRDDRFTSKARAFAAIRDVIIGPGCRRVVVRMKDQ